MKILVTGSSGFIGGYLIPKLLSQGHSVVGIDNFSRHGEIKRDYDTDPRYKFMRGDVKDTKLLIKILKDCDYLVALAAKVGGIGLYHKAPYDIFAENERITISTFDAAIECFKKYQLKKIIVISSSMVYESSSVFPTAESLLGTIPPPETTYGFQKLSCEYFAKGAWQQFELPFTIVRPGNVVGIGDEIGGLSHVIPDLVLKVLIGQNPLKILGNGQQIRQYIHGSDLANGILLSIFSKKALNEDFNFATKQSITVLELAKKIWEKINNDKPFNFFLEKPYSMDVKRNISDVKKAEDVLGFKATKNIDEMIDEVIVWVRESRVFKVKYL